MSKVARFFKMIKPSDFFSETPPPRLIGTESECNIQLVDLDIRQKDYITEAAAAKAGYILIDHCLDNGMGLYIDMDHLEIDSAEALGPRQATAATAASVLVLAKIVEASGLPHNGLHRHSGTIIQGIERTNGYHESYIFPREIANSSFFDSILASHLTSDIWTMGGTVRSGFQLSQKVRGIGDPPITRELDRRTEHGRKPMAMIPPERADTDTIGSEDWARLERRFADAGISLTAQFAGFAAVSLVMRLIEHSDKVNMKKLVQSSFIRFANSAHVFNADLRFREVVKTIDGRFISAVDYQELLAETALELSEKIELPKDEQDAIPLWQVICNELRASNLEEGEYGRLPVLLDFAPRHRFLTQRFPGDKLASDNTKAIEANLTWDRVSPTGGGMLLWDKIGSPYVSKSEVEDLVTNAPPTRAAIRGSLIADDSVEIVNANWANLYTDRGKTIHLDPYLMP